MLALTLLLALAGLVTLVFLVADWADSKAPVIRK